MKSLRTSILAGSVLAFLVSLFHVSIVSAVGSRMPDPNDFNMGTGGGRVMLVVSNDGDLNSLNATASSVIVYFRSSNGEITINNGQDQCGKPPDTNSSADTQFSFYKGQIDDSGTPDIRFMGGRAGCGDYTVRLSNIPGPPLQLGNDTFYPVFIQATIGSDQTNGANAFTYRITQNGALTNSNGYISYYSGSGDRFAIQDRTGDPTSRSDFVLKFGTACNATAPQTKALRWFDDDAGSSSFVGPNFGATLDEIAPNGTRTRVLTKGDFSYQGNDQAGARNYTFKPRYKYEWTWHDIKKINGIQFQLPYDSIFYNINCPPARLGCSVTNPGTRETGSSVTLSMTGTWSGSPPIPPARFRYTVTGPGTNISGTQDVNGSVPPSVSFSSSNIPLNAPGTYNVSASYTAPNDPTSIPANCPITFRVESHPYFRVYNGDTRAGATLPLVGQVGTGTVYAYNTANRGAASQVAAFVRGAIDQFTTANLRAANPLPIKGLTFANSGGGYGGNYGNVGAINDYWRLTNGKTFTAPSLVTIASPPISYLNGATTVSGMTINDSSQSKDVFVNGNVYITGNILFGAGPWNLASGANTLPSFRLIVRGNIYIDNDVSRLDGLFVALPTNASNGAIYTCTTTATNPTAAIISSSCGAPLVVNGALIARQVKFFRVANSVNLGTANESLGSTRAAEAINFNPLVWLAKPPSASGNTLQDYDSITSLPPVL